MAATDGECVCWGGAVSSGMSKHFQVHLKCGTNSNSSSSTLEATLFPHLPRQPLSSDTHLRRPLSACHLPRPRCHFPCLLPIIFTLKYVQRLQQLPSQTKCTSRQQKMKNPKSGNGFRFRPCRAGPGQVLGATGQQFAGALCLNIFQPKRFPAKAVTVWISEPFPLSALESWLIFGT